MLVTAVSWRDFTEHAADFTGPAVLHRALIAGIGTPDPVAALADVGVVLSCSSWWARSSCSARHGLGAADADTLAEFGAALRDAMDLGAGLLRARSRQRVPATPLLLMGGVGGMLLVRPARRCPGRIPLAGLPLLALYSVPATITGNGVSWWTFALMAGRLPADALPRARRAGRALGTRACSDRGREDDADPTAFGVRTGAVRGSAFAIGSTATALALALPILVPTLDVTLFEGTAPASGRSRSPTRWSTCAATSTAARTSR